MAIIDHRPKSGANTSDARADGRDLTAELWVESDDPEDTGHAVIQYLITEGFVYGAPYNVGNDDLSSRSPLDTALYQIDPPQLAPGSSTMWSVLLRYRQVTRNFQNIAGGLADSPLDRRAVLSCNTVMREKTITRAIYRVGFQDSLIGWTPDEERMITNSAGQEVWPQQVIDDQYLVLRVVRNFAAVNVNETTFPETWINSTPLTFNDGLLTVVLGTYQLKLLQWTILPRFEEDTEFLEVTFEGEIKRGPHGWRLRLPDTGFQERPLGPSPSVRSNKLVDIKNAEGVPVTVPALLDGNGVALPDQATATPVYATWSQYKELDIRTTPFFAGLVT